MLRSPLIDPLKQHPDPTPPIPINASAAHLTLLLDLMRNIPPPPSTDFKALNTVLKLSDELGCQIVKERIINQLYSADKGKSWDVFRLASQRDNVDLARKALMNLGKDSRYDKLCIEKITGDLIEGVKPSYLVGWLRIRSRMSYDKLRNETAEDNQARIARAFTPIE